MSFYTYSLEVWNEGTYITGDTSTSVGIDITGFTYQSAGPKGPINWAVVPANSAAALAINTPTPNIVTHFPNANLVPIEGPGADQVGIYATAVATLPYQIIEAQLQTSITPVTGSVRAGPGEILGLLPQGPIPKFGFVNVLLGQNLSLISVFDPVVVGPPPPPPPPPPPAVVVGLTPKRYRLAQERAWRANFTGVPNQQTDIQTIKFTGQP